MTCCYLGLGSNIKSPQRQLQIAIAALRKLPKSTITDISSTYLTTPVGIKAQPMFYNIVVALKTSLPPHSLLKYCQAIELNQQRLRKKRWGARTIDIDILIYGNQIINTKTLCVPHPRMFERYFVLDPLLEILLEDTRATNDLNLRSKIQGNV